MLHSIAKALIKPIHKGLNILLPPVCPATGVEVSDFGAVAPEYWASLRFIRAPYCMCCGVPFGHDMGGADAGALVCAACADNPPVFERARAPLVYDEAAGLIISRFKFADQLQAGGVLATWMKGAGGELIAQADVIVPVPLHRWRLLARRYNQAAILAKTIGEQTGLSICIDGVLRVRATRVQRTLKLKDRAKNVKGAFEVNPRRADALMGKRVLLIDDVLTTGATLNACAQALIKAGAAGVDVLACARVLKE